MDVGPDPPSGAACGGQGEEGGHPHFTGGETHRAVGQGQGWNRDRQAESREETYGGHAAGKLDAGGGP